MPQLEQYTAGLSWNLAGDITSGTATLTPTSYTGWPATGQFRVQIDSELILITNAATHPWPVTRGIESTSAAAHLLGAQVIQRVTAGGLANLIGADQAGTLTATGQEIDFFSGFTISQVGSKIRVVNTAFTNPMTTLDDIVIGAASGVAARLAKGTDTYVLTIDPSTHHVIWAIPAFVNPMTTAGDIVLGTTAGAPLRLAKGSDLTVLTMSASTHLPVWTALPADVGFANPMTTRGDMIYTAAGPTTARRALGTAGQRVKSDGTDLVWGDDIIDINFVIDGAGSTVTTGLKGYLQMNQTLSIVSATLLADQSGSVVVDIFKCTYAAFDVSTHPVSGDKITSSTPPTISTAVKSTDSTLTSWTTTITAGDILAYNVNSATTITRVTVNLKCRKSA